MTHEARRSYVITDELHNRLRRYAKDNGYNINGAAQRCLEFALEELSKAAPATPAAPARVLPAPPVLLPPPPPPPAPTKLRSTAGQPEQFGITWLRKSNGLWFDLLQVCALLGVPSARLLVEIDPADDLLNLSGVDWISEETLGIALDLAADPSLHPRVTRWVASLND